MDTYIRSLINAILSDMSKLEYALVQEENKERIAHAKAAVLEIDE